MKNAVINIKTNALTKKRAKKVAEELGLSLSSVINGFLNTLIKNRSVSFDVNPKEEPSEYMLQALAESREDVRKGRVSPRFSNNEEATAWLKKEVKKYAD